jgi:hypothetical protein
MHCVHVSKHVSAELAGGCATANGGIAPAKHLAKRQSLLSASGLCQCQLANSAVIVEESAVGGAVWYGCLLTSAAAAPATSAELCRS